MVRAGIADRLNTALADRYSIKRELGAGGMATVFLAEDLRHHRPVAIKVLYPELAAAIGPERFLREIEVAARLNHPHIMPLHDSGDADGLLYYVMPYAEGESLRDRLSREHQLPVADALRIAREVADALDYAHRHAVVHRDIKPENILLTDRHAVVADFGIARALAAAGGQKLTATGVTIGTPTYMSPEQVAGRGDVDGRTDQYSLGCVLYEMLAGEPPFTGPTAEALAHQHLSLPPRPVTQLRPTVPATVEIAVSTAMSKGAADRFESAAEFAAALVAVGATEPSASPVATGELTAVIGRVPTGDSTRRTAWVRSRVPILAGAVITLLAAAIGLRWGPLSTWLGTPASIHAGKKAWVLVAEFDGPPDDSLLTVATRELVSAAIDQSSVAASVPRDQIRLALQLAGKPSSLRVDAAIASELAYRSAVRGVLVGTIGRLGKGYSVILRVIDADSGHVVLTEHAEAKNEDQLIPMLGRLTGELCSGIARRRGEIRPRRAYVPIATPSFEAYRLLMRAQGANQSRRLREVVTLSRQALAIDPDFAAAWTTLGVAMSNLGETDSARVAYDEALRRPQRLSEVQRLRAQRFRIALDGDLPAALEVTERILQADPSSAAELQNRGLYLWGLGRFEEALESTRKAKQTVTFRVGQGLIRNEIIQLCNLGRVEEARATAQMLSSAESRLDMRLFVAQQSGDWRLCESTADSVLADPALPQDDRASTLADLGSCLASRGAYGSAMETFGLAERTATAAPPPRTDYRNSCRRARLSLTIATHGLIPPPLDTPSSDSLASSLLTRSLRASLAGDSLSARLLLNLALSRPRTELLSTGDTPRMLLARLEALAGRWEASSRVLRPLAAQRVEVGLRLTDAAGMSTIRWYLAEAYMHLNKPDSAAIVLEHVLADPAPVNHEVKSRGALIPFIHRQLVLIYAREGRLKDAERHWRAFTEMLQTPDPGLLPMIEEARQAIETAGVRSRTATR